MTQLEWNVAGERRFETGVDRGVLYTSDGTGVAWNGLVSVQEKPSGGTVNSYYLDGVKYLNIATSKEFNGTIEAYTYPDEFLEYDGYGLLANGLIVDEQIRKSFAFSYRTRIGNDINNQDHGYKIHIVYGVLAEPSESSYESLGEGVEPLTFAWSFTTIPQIPSSSIIHPTSHVIVDSTKVNPTQLRFIEDYMYGTSDKRAFADDYMYVIEGQIPKLPSLDMILDLFESPIDTFNIQEDSDGIFKLLSTGSVNGDLRGKLQDGIYILADNTRLVESTIPGVYTLEL